MSQNARIVTKTRQGPTGGTADELTTRKGLRRRVRPILYRDVTTTIHLCNNIISALSNVITAAAAVYDDNIDNNQTRPRIRRDLNIYRPTLHEHGSNFIRLKFDNNNLDFFFFLFYVTFFSLSVFCCP